MYLHSVVLLDDWGDESVGLERLGHRSVEIVFGHSRLPLRPNFRLAYHVGPV